MTGKKKQEVVTFKVDDSLWTKLKTVPNRSEFIRLAVQLALDGTCPLCGGTGTLTTEQRKHWETFAENHPLERCSSCEAVHLVCTAADDDSQAEAENVPSGSRESSHSAQPV